MTEPLDVPKATATGEFPNPWVIINDYTKTIVALASGLLAVTITFSGQILGGGISSSQKVFLASAWVLLVVTILSGVAAEAWLTTYLRGIEKKPNACLRFSAVAMTALSLAVICFGMCAILQLNREPNGFVGVTESTLSKVDSIAKIPNARWTVVTATQDFATGHCLFRLLDETTKTSYEVVGDRSSGEILSLKRNFP